jgi:hypothetical protein
MMAGKDTDPFGFSDATRVALEQAHEAMDIYFDFLMNSLSAFPTLELRLAIGGKEKAC